ncbi:glycerate kinase [Proteiniborus sp.]|uniref:glycerate kinase n=1 Tax=Proteiniborus sp. TaxID=2079015 RepID=UPI0033235485
MKFVLAPDSFKESMTAKMVAEAMEIGLKSVFPRAEYVKIPMADGGEGTVQSLVESTSGKIYNTSVIGPTGRHIESFIGILGDGETAVIEMAAASGIQLISESERNPLITTTYGTGELIKFALNKGVEHIIIGIGGSATNDGGVGMLQALGVKFLAENGEEIGKGGGNLNRIHKIDTSHLDPRLINVKIEVACDVTNPLTGKEGASYIFGLQKGATPEMIKQLDNNLKHYAKMIKQQIGKDIDKIPGAGAAGGMGAGLLAFLNVKLVKGIELIIKHTKLESHVKEADYVFTGEGSVDAQTILGKTPFGIALIAQKYNIPVILLTGRIGQGYEILYKHGVTAIFNILSNVGTLDEALKNGGENVEITSKNIGKLIASSL